MCSIKNSLACHDFIIGQYDVSYNRCTIVAASSKSKRNQKYYVAFFVEIQTFKILSKPIYITYRFSRSKRSLPNSHVLVKDNTTPRVEYAETRIDPLRLSALKTRVAIAQDNIETFSFSDRNRWLVRCRFGSSSTRGFFSVRFHLYIEQLIFQ